MNVVTVGAVHADDAALPVPDHRVDLFGGLRLPSPLSTVASGYNRAVKPEVLFPGGRQLYHAPVGNGADPARFAAVQTLQPPGQKVAWPGQAPMELGKTVFSRGTSNATALGTRCAAQIYEHLQQLKAAPGGDQLDEESIPVIIKALLVHGASWGNAADEIATALSNADMDWRVTQRLQARFLGYGEVDPARAMVSTDQRATIVGWGKLAREKAHVFDVPLPPCQRQQAEAAAHRDAGLAVADQQPTQKLPPGPAMVPRERERDWRQQTQPGFRFRSPRDRRASSLRG